MSLRETEAAKYAACWGLPDYLGHSPGKHNVPFFGDMARPQAGETVIDVGCGHGAGGKALKELYGLKPFYFDLVRADDSLEPFVQGSMWDAIPRCPLGKGGVGSFHYGYCCDVMEHIPEAFTMLAVRNILNVCRQAFFSISFLPDHFGKYVGAPLHLTVKPFTWWRDNLSEVGTVVEARDRLGEGLFYVEP